MMAALTCIVFLHKKTTLFYSVTGQSLKLNKRGFHCGVQKLDNSKFRRVFSASTILDILEIRAYSVHPVYSLRSTIS